MKSFRIPPVFQSLLTPHQGKIFSVTNFTEAYQASPQCRHSDAKAASQYVRRNLLRLEKVGVVKRDATSTPRRLLFRVSDHYDETHTPTIDRISQAHISPFNTEQFRAVLEDRLKDCRTDMLAAIGETEEYKALCDQHPEVQTRIQPLYDDARDRSSRILGKVRALESLLSGYGG